MEPETPTAEFDRFEISTLVQPARLCYGMAIIEKWGDRMIRLKRDYKIYLYCLLVAAACLSICSKSSPLYPINDWTDANAYFTCGKGMLKGMVIYRDLYEHKGPMVYALHALCALITTQSFLGVFVMEIIVVSLFLMAVYKLLTLYGAKRSVWVLLPVAAALTLSSLSFYSGDSTEELCLPMLAWALYYLLRWQRLRAPERMPAKTLIAGGLLAGFVLWIKFTILGFFIPWIAGLFIYHLLRGQARQAFACVGWFLAGIGLATLPWIVYFGVNSAILDWLRVYIYDNLFLYSNTETLTLAHRIKAMLLAAWDWVVKNPGYSVPLAAGAIWFSVSKRYTTAEKLWLWNLILCLGVGVFIGGKPYEYYGFIFSAFAAVAALPLCLLLDRMMGERKLPALLLSGGLFAASLLYCFTVSMNAKYLLEPREDTMQYRFAAIINEVPNATLLNYYFMDAGFYTAANVAPSVKYFHYTNVPLAEMMDEQNRYLAEGVTDFVVTRGYQPDWITDRYTLVATEPTVEDIWYDAVYLYERSDLLPPA